MEIQETIDNLKQQVEDLQNEIKQLKWQSKVQQSCYRDAGTLYSVQTKSGGFEKIFPSLDQAAEYYSSLRTRLLDRQSSGSRSTVELELYRTKMLFNRDKWEQI